MLSKEVMAWGAIIVGILMALTKFMSWNESLHYLWAVLVLLWGVLRLQE
ncbi:hypothetical protein HOC99_03765 [Candidatus Woesearchaeota archaeon]|jgi:hypothetical protein|nr:hypothetical protein [Candidatus Woesearchaeota archaeon]MBT5740736.1 hypothetical protein [Candidatus Woesearchaeota archaeon]MBT7962770.1 hypothetical protein [Candidatus Woesearchaeota archaeon]